MKNCVKTVEQHLLLEIEKSKAGKLNTQSIRDLSNALSCLVDYIDREMPYLCYSDSQEVMDVAHVK